jgi:aromatic ring-cleaving dioxygenase
MKHHISMISFDGDQGVTITYMTEPDDARMDGALIQSHQMTIGRHPSYNDELDELEEMATAVLRDAIEDFKGSDPWVPPLTGDDDDSDRGLGY